MSSFTGVGSGSPSPQSISACHSSAPGSVNGTVTETGSPACTFRSAGNSKEGATFVTSTTRVSRPRPPSSSVAFTFSV